MQRYWERASTSVEAKAREVSTNADPDAAKRLIDERAAPLRGEMGEPKPPETRTDEVVDVRGEPVREQR